LIFESFIRENVIELIIEILNHSLPYSLPVVIHFINKTLTYKSTTESSVGPGSGFEKSSNNDNSVDKNIAIPSILEVQYNLLVFLYIFTRSLSASSTISYYTSYSIDNSVNLTIPCLLNLFKLYTEYFQSFNQKYFGVIFNIALLVFFNISNRGFVLSDELNSKLNLYKQTFEENDGINILNNLFNYLNSSASSSSSSSSNSPSSNVLFKSSLLPNFTSFQLKPLPNPRIVSNGYSSQYYSLSLLRPSSNNITQIQKETSILIVLSLLSFLREADAPLYISGLVSFASKTSSSSSYSSFKISSSDFVQISFKKVLDGIKNLKPILAKK
jgi:hypothetical protein